MHPVASCEVLLTSAVLPIQRGIGSGWFPSKSFVLLAQAALRESVLQDNVYVSLMFSCARHRMILLGLVHHFERSRSRRWMECSTAWIQGKVT